MITQLINMLRTGVPLSIVIINVCLIVIVLTFSLSIHELMHGFMAYKLGDDTAKLQGRLTFNPLAHLDPIGSIMMLVAGFGWAKPVPINYGRLSYYKNRSVSIRLVSLAGVGSNFVVAFVSYFLHQMLLVLGLKSGLINATSGLDMSMPLGGVIIEVGLALFSLLYIYNLLLMAFNLLPLPPLDGYRFIETFFSYNLRQKLAGFERYGFFILLMLVVAGSFTGFNPLFALISFIQIPFQFIIQTPVDALFGLFMGL